MGLPERKWGNGYRYGFNGKENDGETSTQDYGMRIYNSSLGRFLSVDPITKSYPMLTPYQFASNSPVSGVDLDGQEYIHFIVYLDKNGSFIRKSIAQDFRNMSEAEMNKIHKTTNFYKQYSAGFGALGKGVQYTYLQQNDKGNFEVIPSKKNWEVEQQTIGSEITRHGLYYGAGSITKAGPISDPKPGVGDYDFSYKPIDMVDALGREHDKEEDKPNFKGWQHPQNIFADIRFVKRLDKYLEMAESEGYVDPFTGRKPSTEALAAARNAKSLFTQEIGRKKVEMMLKFYDKKVSSFIMTSWSNAVEKVEKQKVSLPVPKSNDK